MLVKIIKSIFLIIVLLNINLAKASCSNCNESEITVLFFNGVGNDYEKAWDSMLHLRKSIGNESKKGAKLNYDVFYNTSINKVVDGIEALQQRLVEFTSLLFDRFEIFSNRKYFEYTSEEYKRNVVGTSAKVVKTKIYNSLVDFKQLIKESLVDSLISKTTKTDYCRHNKRLNGLMSDCKKVLFVAHSQGNLFANNAYENAIKNNYNENMIKVIHIAPASVKLYGEYVLYDKDYVIDGVLRKASIGVGVPKSNFRFSLYQNQQKQIARKFDWSGHGFSEIYLNPELEISKTTTKLINDALDSLSCN